MAAKKLVPFLLFIIICACSHSQAVDVSGATREIGTTKMCVMSDDSLITFYWWDTGEGGTAKNIEAVCKFKTRKGDTKEELRPLLSIVHSDEDHSHHEVSKIVNLDTECGQRVYFFYLRAKVGSNEYAHDIVTMTIEEDSLMPVSMLKYGDHIISHISLETSF